LRWLARRTFTDFDKLHSKAVHRRSGTFRPFLNDMCNNGSGGKQEDALSFIRKGDEK